LNQLGYLLRVGESAPANGLDDSAPDERSYLRVAHAGPIELGRRD
jgi:hypothetical protein